MKNFLILILFVSAMAMSAWADDQAGTPVSLSTPSMFGPLALSSNPFNIDAGPLGKLYASGILSGFALAQDNHVPHDQASLLDLSNGQLALQKIDGPVQYYVQAGGYILPALGTPYLRMDKTTEDFFGPVPVAFAKFVPNDNFSVMVGKLYTLIGTENTFTFQNANIERGLLWNQTNAVNRGVQVNYTQGAFSGSLALSDGFYSDKLNWLSGLVTYTIDPANSLTLIASGNFDHSGTSTLATPLAQDNSQIYDLNYSYTTGAWTFSPTLQYTHVPQDVTIGLMDSASTYGAGLTTKYAFNSHWNLAARAEVIDSTGSAAAPSLVNGPGSNAWSLTVTPTWQQGIFFARVEGSYVKATNTTAGDAFGPNGTDTSQARLMLETGIFF